MIAEIRDSRPHLQMHHSFVQGYSYKMSVSNAVARQAAWGETDDGKHMVTYLLL